MNCQRAMQKRCGLGFFSFVLLCLGSVSLMLSDTVHALQAPLPKVLTLYQGQSKAFNVSGAIRVTVGDTSLISATMLKTGDIVLVADGQGETNLLVWYEDGSTVESSLIIVEEDGYRQAREVESLLENINGIDISLIGRRVVVDGQIDSRDLTRVKAVQQRYGDILILAREISAFEQKMLHFDVRITEISRDVTEELGVNWSTSFAGPTLNYEKAWNQNAEGGRPGTNENASYLFGDSASIQSSAELAIGEQLVGSVLTLDQKQKLVDAQERSYTYWGIGTSIISMINLLESNGAATTLTRPRISARSGGMAQLLVGCEIPVVTSSINGPTVSYKNYGIQLDVSPEVDQYDNIVGQVAVEVSALDLSNAVDGQPAFRKRSSKNDIRLSPGETLALAGLIQQEEQIAYSGLKWLQDIPVLGNLFRNKSFTSGETELVILITPTEIEDLSAGENQKLVDRAQEIRSEFEALKYELSNYPKLKRTEELETSEEEAPEEEAPYIPAPTNPSEKIAAQLPAIAEVSAEPQVAADTMTGHDADAKALANLVSNDEPAEVPLRSVAVNEALIDEVGVPIFWVLQVAAVDREARAAEILEALQEAGYKAFYSQYNEVDRKLFRVQVGPSANQRYLRDVKLKVDVALNVDAKLLRHVQ